MRTLRGDVTILATVPAGTDYLLFLGSRLLLLVVVVVIVVVIVLVFVAVVLVADAVYVVSVT